MSTDKKFHDIMSVLYSVVLMRDYSLAIYTLENMLESCDLTQDDRETIAEFIAVLNSDILRG